MYISSVQRSPLIFSLLQLLVERTDAKAKDVRSLYGWDSEFELQITRRNKYEICERLCIHNGFASREILFLLLQCYNLKEHHDLSSYFVCSVLCFSMRMFTTKGDFKSKPPTFQSYNIPKTKRFFSIQANASNSPEIWTSLAYLKVWTCRFVFVCVCCMYSSSVWICVSFVWVLALYCLALLRLVHIMWKDVCVCIAFLIRFS